MLVLSVRDEFNNVVKFRVKLRTYLIEWGFEIDGIKNEISKFIARWAGEVDGLPCIWFIYTAKLKSGIISIETLSPKRLLCTGLLAILKPFFNIDPTKRLGIMHKELR